MYIIIKDKLYYNKGINRVIFILNIRYKSTNHPYYIVVRVGEDIIYDKVNMYNGYTVRTRY